MHQGQLIVDATASPQDIAYLTDLNLLNDAREKAEELIDLIYDPVLHHKKPRTYRNIARTDYLRTAQLKIKSKKQIHRAVKKQLAYLRRNLKKPQLAVGSVYQRVPAGRQGTQIFAGDNHSLRTAVQNVQGEKPPG